MIQLTKLELLWESCSSSISLPSGLAVKSISLFPSNSVSAVETGRDDHVSRNTDMVFALAKISPSCSNGLTGVMACMTAKVIKLIILAKLLSTLCLKASDVDTMRRRPSKKPSAHERPDALTLVLYFAPMRLEAIPGLLLVVLCVLHCVICSYGQSGRQPWQRMARRALVPNPAVSRMARAHANLDSTGGGCCPQGNLASRETLAVTLDWILGRLELLHDILQPQPTRSSVLSGYRAKMVAKAVLKIAAN